jgi:hypothetical protein
MTCTASCDYLRTKPIIQFREIEVPALPVCSYGVSGERPFTSLPQYRFRVHVEETSSIFLTYWRFSNGLRALMWGDRIRLG